MEYYYDVVIGIPLEVKKYFGKKSYVTTNICDHFDPEDVISKLPSFCPECGHKIEQKENISPKARPLVWPKKFREHCLIHQKQDLFAQDRPSDLDWFTRNDNYGPFLDELRFYWPMNTPINNHDYFYFGKRVEGFPGGEEFSNSIPLENFNQTASHVEEKLRNLGFDQKVELILYSEYA